MTLVNKQSFRVALKVTNLKSFYKVQTKTPVSDSPPYSASVCTLLKEGLQSFCFCTELISFNTLSQCPG